ncbi:hypothetical protein [Paenibacillus polysaccharolyticus]|uniref:hypothetical protein n=1 Tax=Paenibacillus polysaccharolyticus TaxID=582692 RepID=UPI00280BC28D|nr:hypothetical protein [Paenibacillus polysaccharolyticus]
MGINSRAFSNPSTPDSNLAPLIVSSPVLTFDPNSNLFYPGFWNVSDFFRDPNQDSLSYAIVQQPDDLSGLSLSLNGGQQLAFGGVPTLPTSFTVRATDPRGLYADLTSTLQFAPEPVSHAIVDATGSRTQVDLNAFFRDRDNDPLTFELNGTSHAANVRIEGGLLTYSGTILAPVRMGVTATDPQGWSAYNVVEIQGDNLAPLTVSSPVLTFDPKINRFYPGFWNVSDFFRDPNQDSLSYAIVQQPDDLSGLSLSLNGGQQLAFGGVPTLPTSFTVRATDPRGLYADLTSTLQFAPEPVSHAIVDATGTRTQVDLNAFFRDRDNDPLTFELNGTSHAANVRIEGGLLTYSGTILAPVRMGVTATDPQGWSAYNVVEIQGDNLAPLTVSSPMLTFDPKINRFYPGFWNVSDFFQDPNQDSLSYAIVQQPDDLSGLSLSLKWGQQLGFGGVPTLPTSFTVRATDPRGLYADLTSTLQFAPEPVSHAIVDATGTRTQVDLNAFFRDRDNDPLTFELNGTSHAANVRIEGGLLTYSGTILAPVRMGVTATDPQGWSAYNVVEIQGENVAPLTVSSPVLTFDPNKNRFYPNVWNIADFFQDPNQDSLSYAIVQQPDDLSGLSLSLNWGQQLAFGGVPTLPTSFTVRATDPGGLYVDLTSRLQFAPEPVSHAMVEATGSQTQVDLNAFFRDRDNDPLTFELSGTSYAANVSIKDGLLTYSGTILAPVRMGVTATDPQGWSAYNVVEIQGENVAPLTVSSPVLTFDPNKNRFYPNVWNIADFFQDPNQDSLSYAIVQQPDDLSGLSLSLNWGQQLAFGGVPTLPTSFTVRATDPGGLYVDLTSRLQFAPEPVSHAMVDATGSQTQVDLNAFFRDRDNDPLTFVIDGISSSSSISAWVDGNMLSVSGIINSSVKLNIRATDSNHFKINNTVHIEPKSN